ncbi:hypothetical protein [Acetivibrio cellulolyticus]|nr:hypothetical protein [Acetivibrio cellulolyticus]
MRCRASKTDIKCKSPDEGDLLMGRDSDAIAKNFNAATIPLI